MKTRAEFEAAHPEQHDTIVCDGEWVALPPFAARNITRTERSDMARWWRTEFIATLPDELRQEWGAYLITHENKRIQYREERRLFTDDKWTVFKVFVEEEGIALPQVGLDLIAFVENG